MLKFQSALDREVKLAPVDLSAVDEAGTFSGYASLFGVADLGRDIVEPGAFRRSLIKRPANDIRMLYQHDPSTVIGHWTSIEEDTRGLKVTGQLCLSVTKAKEVHALMRRGALDGLSIGFRTVEGHTNSKTGLRHLSQIDLWEISVVTFPLLPEARVDEVKSGNDLPTLRDFERYLTRDAGFTRKQARTIISSGYSSLTGERDAAYELPSQVLARKNMADAILFLAKRIHPNSRTHNS